MAPSAPQRLSTFPRTSVRVGPRPFSLESLRNDVVRTFAKRGILGWGNSSWPGGKPVGLRQQITRLIPGDGQRADTMYAERFGRTHGARLGELGWLKHFSASGKALHALYAIELLKTWSREEQETMRGGEAARALLALLVDGHTLATKGPKAFAAVYLRMTDNLARRVYTWRPATGPDSALRAIALSYVLTAMHGLENLRPRVKDAFDTSLPHVILPDGGHVDGNPESLLRLLLQILPLRDAMLKAREPIPASLNAAIDRMLPMLNMLINADGGFAGVRGSKSNTEAIALCLKCDQNNGQPLAIAPHSGFARIASENSLLIADTTPLNGFTLDLSVAGGRLLTTSHKNILAFRRFSTESPAELVDFDDGNLLVTGVRIGQLSLSRHLFVSAGGTDIRIEDIATGLDEPFENEIVIPCSVDCSPAPEQLAVTLTTGNHEIWQIKMRGGEMRFVQESDACRLIMMANQDNGTSSLTWAIKKLA